MPHVLPAQPLPVNPTDLEVEGIQQEFGVVGIPRLSMATHPFLRIPKVQGHCRHSFLTNHIC